MRWVVTALALAVAACDAGAASLDPQNGLELSGRVVDQADLLDPSAEDLLTAELAALEQRAGDQLVIVTTPGLRGQPIEKFSLDLGKRWGIGRADLDNGVLLVVAPAERKVRIEVGTGLEGLLTDEVAGDIIRGRILPRFRAGDLPGGIVSGARSIAQVLRSDVRRPQRLRQAHRKAA